MDDRARNVVVTDKSKFSGVAERLEATTAEALNVVNFVTLERIRPLYRAVLLAQVRCASAV